MEHYNHVRFSAWTGVEDHPLRFPKKIPPDSSEKREAARGHHVERPIRAASQGGESALTNIGTEEF